MDNLWWATVPNSVKFISDIVTAFNEGSSVVCVISENCEWAETLRTIIKENILSGIDKTHEISGKEIGDCPPGEYMTEQFVKKELRTQYRTSIGYEAFLTRIEADTSLIHSYVYIKDLNERQIKAWLDFIYKYNKLHTPNSSRCKFIIESSINVIEEQKGIRIFRRDDYLHNYDITILCMMATSSMPLNDAFREYITELATLCSQNDPEFAAELIGMRDNLIENTHDAVEKIVRNSLRSNSEHFKPVENLDHIIWKAQNKVFFPLIERYRLNLVKKYEKEIPVHKCITNMIGEVIKSIYDIELYTIKQLYDNKYLHMSQNDYNELLFFKKCRNDLAHLKTLSFESLKKITAIVVTI